MRRLIWLGLAVCLAAGTGCCCCQGPFGRAWAPAYPQQTYYAAGNCVPCQ